MTDKELEDVASDLKKADLLPIAVYTDFGGLKKALSERINQLITSDFSQLISVLYRLDISEKKLRIALATAGDIPASDIIAEMVVERQLQKSQARKMFGNNSSISDEERW